MEAMIWEYNYLLGTQLEEQRNYYEEKINEMKQKFDNSPTTKDGNEKIEFLQNENEDLKKKIDEFDKEYKLFVKKIKMTKERNEQLAKEVDQLNDFNSLMEDNIKNYAKVSYLTIYISEYFWDYQY